MNRLSKLACMALICLFATATASLAAEAVLNQVSMTPDQMKWVPSPDAAGVMTATTWGDPATGPHGAFHKFKAGVGAPLHTHTANLKIVVISGTMVLAGESGKAMRFPAGSFFTQPNTFKHTTKCLEGADCLIYAEADAKWDLKPVAAKK
jgi:anti-sigma factor ChrR (cupin superfamily)